MNPFRKAAPPPPQPEKPPELVEAKAEELLPDFDDGEETKRITVTLAEYRGEKEAKASELARSRRKLRSTLAALVAPALVEGADAE
jgi:hypothetical protein